MHKSNKRVGWFIYRRLSLHNLQQKAQTKLRQLTSDEAQANFSEIMKGTPSIANRDSSNTWIDHGHSKNESVIYTAEFTHINVNNSITVLLYITIWTMKLYCVLYSVVQWDKRTTYRSRKHLSFLLMKSECWEEGKGFYVLYVHVCEGV